MEKVYIIRGIHSAWEADYVYSDYDEARRATTKANKNRSWFDRLMGVRWIVRTLNVIN